MKAVMQVAITKPQGGIRFAGKEVDLPFAPYVGMMVWCVAWKDGREVKGVILQFDPDYGEPSLIIDLESETAANAKEQEQLVGQYRGHGWTV
jgi:hypothetical protein